MGYWEMFGILLLLFWALFIASLLGLLAFDFVMWRLAIADKRVHDAERHRHMIEFDLKAAFQVVFFPIIVIVDVVRGIYKIFKSYRMETIR